MKLNNLLFTCLIIFGLTSCEKDEESIENLNPKTETREFENSTSNSEIEVESFIYNGLNELYLYKANVPELDDDYFQSSNEKTEFLASSSSPEDLFDNLTAPIDRFSFLTDDYEKLEEVLVILHPKTQAFASQQ